MLFPGRLLVHPDGGCAWPGEGLHFWGICPCTWSQAPLQRPSSILDLQIQPTAQPRAEHLGLPGVSGSHSTARSHPPGLLRRKASGFSRAAGPAENTPHTGEPGKATARQFSTSSAQKHFQIASPSTLLLIYSLIATYIDTYKWAHTGSLSAFRHWCKFWDVAGKCCGLQEPWGSESRTRCHSCHDCVLTRVCCAQRGGARDLHRIWTTSSSPELPVCLTRHLLTP